MILADLDPSTIVPVGTITGMLVAIFVLFMRDNARNDERADVVSAKLVAAAEADRDRAVLALKEERKLRIVEVEKAETRCAQAAAVAHAEWAEAKKFLYDRIAHLETLLYGETRTIRPHDVED